MPSHSCVQQVARRLRISVFLVLRNGGGRVTTTARSAPPLRLAAPRACCENCGTPAHLTGALRGSGLGTGSWSASVADLLALVIPAGVATFIVPAVQAVLLGIAAVLGMSSNNPKRRAAARGDGARPCAPGVAADSEQPTLPSYFFPRKLRMLRNALTIGADSINPSNMDGSVQWRRRRSCGSSTTSMARKRWAR